MTDTNKPKSSFHNIKILGPKNTPTGYAYQVFLDDKPLEGVTEVKLSLGATGLAHLQLTMVTMDYEVEGAVIIDEPPASDEKPSPTPMPLARPNPKYDESAP